MRKTLLILAGLLTLSLSFCACKKNNDKVNETERREAALKQFASEINAGADKEMGNGSILTEAYYKSGDQYFVYSLKVEDNRYKKISDDSLKNAFYRTLHTSRFNKVVNTTSRHGVGIQYKIATPSGERTVTFSPEEIKAINPPDTTKR